MILHSIHLHRFRNYEKASFSFSPSLNVIYGANAVGKTNLLESIFFLTGARSWRCRKDTEMILFGSRDAVVEAFFHAGGRDTELKLILSHQEKRRIFAGGVALHSPRELLGKIPSVLFAPEDLQLLRGGPACRRRFMDMALCQIYPRYMQMLSDYRRLQMGKTKILKSRNERLHAALPEYHLRMAAVSVEIHRYRVRFVTFIEQEAQRMHALCAPGEVLTLSYISQVKDIEESAEELAEHMSRRLAVEMQQGLCLVGIHRDDIDVVLNGKPVREYASQGQTRTAAISMKLAERAVLMREFGEPPLLLLDDVLSELDAERQLFLLKNVADGQVFITTCSADGLVSAENGKNILLPP